MSYQNKNEYIGFAITPDEKQKVIEIADKEGIKVSELCRRSVQKQIQAQQYENDRLSYDLP